MHNDKEKAEELAAVENQAQEPAPATIEPSEPRKINLAARIYGVFMIVMGIFNIAVFVILAALLGLAVWFASLSPEAFDMLLGQANGILGEQSTMAIALYAISIVLSFVSAVLAIRVGRSLFKSDRRRVALRVRTLIVATILSLLIQVMLSGVTWSLAPSVVELGFFIALSVRIDPTLAAERAGEREAEKAANAEAVARGMEGRDLTGKGYLELNFFTLFWEFVVCCVLGLVLEIIWHMTVVDPGAYEDRAGLLYGPFSPIYGFGAVLVTLALNRLYNKNPLIVFGVSGIVGGAFEAAVSLFMQYGFGATAWDYSDYTIFGMPDPVAVLAGGRTSTMFLIIWGILGLVWVKAFLPLLLKCVNLIPWRFRYGLTAVCALLMLVNGTMTLMSLDCWFERTSGVAPQTEAEQFFATYYDNDWMEHRFESMTITPQDSTRVDAAVNSAMQGATSDVDLSELEDGDFDMEDFDVDAADAEDAAVTSSAS